MSLVFSIVAEIALVPSENRLLLLIFVVLVDHMQLHKCDRNKMYNTNQFYRFSQHNTAINITSRCCRETIKLQYCRKLREYRTYRQCSEMN